MKISKYYVAAEADRYCGSGMFGSILGLTLKYFTVQIEGQVNADILYEAINKDRDENIRLETLYLGQRLKSEFLYP